MMELLDELRGLHADLLRYNEADDVQPVMGRFPLPILAPTGINAQYLIWTPSALNGASDIVALRIGTNTILRLAAPWETLMADGATLLVPLDYYIPRGELIALELVSGAGSMSTYTAWILGYPI